ncbi:MAG: oligosaccharide flippase family protein [Geminicoccaceae bacterium]
MSAGGAGRLATLALARAAAAGLGFLTVLLIARALPPEQLGRWSLALTVQGYALHLGEFGLRSVVTTEAAHAGRHLSRLLRRYLGLRLALTAVTLALVTGACALWRPQELALVALATASILPIALQLDWLALVDGRILLASGLLLVRPLAFLLFIPLVPAAAGPDGVAACFLAAWLVAAALSWVTLRRPVARGPGVVPTAARMLRRGGNLAVVTLGNQLQLSADLLVAGWLLGAAAAGDYWLACQVLVAGLVFANAAGQMALARLPALTVEPRLFARAVASELRRIMAVGCAAAALALLLAPAALPLLFGVEHAGAAAALPWLLPWFVLQHATTVLQAALIAERREREALRANLLGALVLVPAMAAAALAGSLPAFALARAAAEAARLAALGGVPRRALQTSTSA